MRKISIGFILIVAFVLAPTFAGVASAQDLITKEDFDYAAAYRNYINVLDEYKTSLSEYRLAKAQYQQAGTLVSQSNAREATSEMLKSRDRVVINYLTAVRMKVLEAEGLSGTVKDGLISRLDTEIFWFQDHLSRLDSAGTLQDLTADSNLAASRFEETQRIVYESLATVANGKATVLRNDLNELLTRVRAKHLEIRTNGDLEVGSIDRWLSEIDNKLTRSLDKSISAEVAIQSLYEKDRPGQYLSIYNQVQISLEESTQLLREASRFIKEIFKVFTGEN